MTTIKRFLRGMLVAFASWGTLGVVFFSPGTAHAQRLVAKQCDHCKRPVSLSSQVGQRCPHCGVTWGARRNRYIHSRSTKWSPRSNFRAFPRRTANTIVTSPGGRYTAQKSAPGWISVRDKNTGQTLNFRHAAAVPLIKEAFSSDDKFLVLVNAKGGSATAYALATGAPCKVSLRQTLAAAFLPGEHVIVLVKPKVIYFRRIRDNRLTYGRISAGGGRITAATLNYGSGQTTIFVRMTNRRTGVYSVTGRRLTTGQRLSPGYRSGNRGSLVSK